MNATIMMIHGMFRGNWVWDNCKLKQFAGHTHWVVGEPGWEDIAQYIYDWLHSETGKTRGQAA